MYTLIAAILASLFCANVAEAQTLEPDLKPIQNAKSTSPVVLDGALVLAKEKAILGPRVRNANGQIVGGLDALFIYKTSDAAEDGFDGSFLGHLFAFSLGAQLEPTNTLALSAGSGVDVWYLWGINLDEAKFALPLWAEGRFWMTPKLSAFVNAKINLVASDGLDFGRTREQVSSGAESDFPVMVTVGLGIKQ